MAAVRRVTRRRAFPVPLLVVGALLAIGGCSGGARPAGAPSSGASAVPPPPASFPPGLQPAGGTAYAFGLPSEPAFVAGKGETRPDGTVIRRWRRELSAGGPACSIVASEQPAYTGDFPNALLLVFDTLAENTDKVVVNESVPPPAGAVGAIRQESTFSAKLADDRTVPGRLYQRQLLTPGKTLVSLAVAGPETTSDPCRAAEVAASLQLTGKEAKAASS